MELPLHWQRASLSRARVCTPRFLIAATIGVACVVFLVHTAREERWVRDLGYLTRPLWDKSDETPHTILPHYDFTNTSNAPARELCALHRWSPSPTQPRVFDAFLVSTELDLLEIRIHELIDVVDYFLIIEATRSFSGQTRNTLPFAQEYASLQNSTSGRFAFAQHKIRYLLVDDLVEHPEPSPFTNEAAMRAHMDQLLVDAGAKESDIVLMSDVDEIPSSRTVALLKECGDWPSPLHLNMRNYRYSFEFPLVDGGYWRPKAVRWTSDVRYTHGKAGDVMLSEAGWHCSWCVRSIDDVQFKMTVHGYSHNDRVKSSFQLSPARIAKHMCDGSDIFDMLPEAYTFHSLYTSTGPPPKSTSFLHIPDYLLHHPDKFQFLLPGGCAREEKYNVEAA